MGKGVSPAGGRGGHTTTVKLAGTISAGQQCEKRAGGRGVQPGTGERDNPHSGPPLGGARKAFGVKGSE